MELCDILTKILAAYPSSGNNAPLGNY